MSSPKKIGRWKRFEIAFAEGQWAQISFRQAEETQTLDEMRELRKIEEKSDEKNNPNPRPAAERKSSFERNASTTKTARLDDSTAKAAFEPASKSLWTEARREKAKETKKRDD